MKYIALVMIIGLAYAAQASDLCKQRVVKECNMSGLNCTYVVVCD